MQRLPSSLFPPPQTLRLLPQIPHCPGLLAAAVVLLGSLPALAAAPGSPRQVTAPLLHGDSGDDPLPRLRQMWDRRASAVSAIRYVLSGEVTHAAGSVVSPGDMGPDNDPPGLPPGGFPVEDTTRPVSVQWLIDFENEYFRKESRDWSFNTISRAFRPFVRIEVSGGDGLRGYWPRKANTSPQYRPHRDKEEILFWRDRDLGLVVSPADLPVLLAHGRHFSRDGSLLSGHLASHDGLVVTGTVQMNGHDCVILSDRDEIRTGGQKVDYFVDTRRGGAVLRREVLREGIPVQTLDITWSEHALGWMPAEWRFAAWSVARDGDAQQPLTSYRMRVDKLEFNPATSRSDFQVPMKPGTIVLRRDADFQKQIVTSDGTLQPYDPLATPRAEPNRDIWWILLVVNLTIIVLLYVARVIRRNRTSQSQIPSF